MAKDNPALRSEVLRSPLVTATARGVGGIAGPLATGRSRIVQPPRGIGAEEFIEDGRLLLIATTVQAAKRHRTDRGETNIYTFVLYGDVRSAANVERLLGVNEAWARKVGGAPIFIFGDLNVEEHESEILKEWGRTEYMTDIFKLHAHARGREPEPTSAAGRRIDFAFANYSARKLVKRSGMKDLFSTHKTLEVESNVEPMGQLGAAVTSGHVFT